jgi:hypothetical protein
LLPARQTNKSSHSTPHYTEQAYQHLPFS